MKINENQDPQILSQYTKDMTCEIMLYSTLAMLFYNRACPTNKYNSAGPTNKDKLSYFIFNYDLWIGCITGLHVYS